MDRGTFRAWMHGMMTKDAGAIDVSYLVDKGKATLSEQPPKPELQAPDLNGFPHSICHFVNSNPLSI